ncbi:hypothetical protein F2Q69_00028918 [Brassica cretica]|uniref:Uncharacterized protein n=1 Tax=Brassica cretica TaxID=69181 RepID=A0A8S9RWF1_BRACR|nr:hypothetical protein F2Q69_00028918 [Brassica cretica]
MEDMDFGQTSIDEEIGISIDGARAISIDKSRELSVDNAHQTSIDNTPREAGKYSLTNDANERADERRTKRRLDTNSPAPVPDRDPWPRQPEDGPIPFFENFLDTRKAAKSLECRNRAIQDA